ncbi:MAG: Ig-like domain-containing protein [Puniceicoccaceae bacterium]
MLQVLLLVSLLGSSLLAKPPIRSDFFSVYPSVVGTQLDNLPSNSGHCGVCHYDFGGGGTLNPYGAALQTLGVGNKDDIPANITTLGSLDSDGDTFSSALEVTGTGLGYPNIPTFPGLSDSNKGLVSNIPLSEVSPYLTPSLETDDTPPVVTVLSPNGGEVLTANQATTITWTATDENEVVDVRIWESTDGGSSYKQLALGLDNDGSYTWHPANRPTTTALIRIEAVDEFTNAAQDVSDAVFTIVSPPGGVVPTTLRDFDMPGSQPFEGGLEAASPEDCASCHGDYDAGVEPYYNWQGSMMSLASIDPLFEANLAIANQDAPDSGDLCLRCHISNGWLQGRSVPTDGGAMEHDDMIGVSCDFCHRMVDPDYEGGVSPLRDLTVLSDLDNPFPGSPEYGNGMYVIDPAGIQRGPFDDAQPAHEWIFSPFHQSSAICGTCHDVSNPVFNRDEFGVYQPNAFDSPNADYSPHSMAPVERTYSEWLNSQYNTPLGVYAPEFAGNKAGGMVSSCQDCHMRDTAGYGANPTLEPQTPYRDDVPLHDMTGGSTWLPPLIAAAHPEEVDLAAVMSGVARATYMLENAATLSQEGSVGKLVVRVTNETGHKLPTGYPEGRRIWLNVQFYDALDTLIGESAAYDASTGVLTKDAEATVYEIHPGIGENIAGVVGLPVGPSLHFVLNNEVFEDNRIPPRGFTNAAFEAFGGAPVGHHYDDYQYWDEPAYVVPTGAVRAEVKLYYQSTSKEFIEFLRDENTTNSKGQEMFDLWDQNGKCPPTLMESASYAVLPESGDYDDDGVDNIAEIAMGSDPWDVADTCRPHSQRIVIGEQAHTAIAFTRLQDLSGLDVTVEVSTDLENWDPAGPSDIVEHSVVDNGDGTEDVVIRMANPVASDARQFMRLRVEAL